MKNRVLHNPLNGRFTMTGLPSRHGRGQERDCHSYEDAISQKASNYWSATENSSNNAWNVNFNSGNVNNNNKYNGNVVRPVAAYDGFSYDLSLLPERAWTDAAFLVFLKTAHDAYVDCLRGKMTSPQALEYMQIAYLDVPLLAWELWTGTYKPGTSTCFLVKYPKLREVFAAMFRDRIVHHWICLRLEPLFEKRFVAQGDVSFNCRKGYGTDKAVAHLAEGMRRVSGNYRKEAWVFKGDLVGFFMSIDKALLWYLLERFMLRWQKREQRNGFFHYALAGMPPMYWEVLLRVTHIVVMHCPEKDCVLNSDPALWQGMAASKSLFGCGEGKGEPIGNLTTQLFANFLMSFFDMYVLWLFRGMNYSYERFVDDWTVTCDDEAFLLASISKMEAFLRDKLLLTMHRDKRYLQPVGHGTAFVGSYVKPGREYLSNRTLARMEERATGFRRVMEREGGLSDLDRRRIEQVMNSYLGFCKGRKTYEHRRHIIESMGNMFWRNFYVKGHFESIRARRRVRHWDTTDII